MLTRSLKPIKNSNLHIRFLPLAVYSKVNNCILDGELYCKKVPFNELSGIIRSDNKELPDDLDFYCFDLLTDDNPIFAIRHMQYKNVPDCQLVPQLTVCSADEVRDLMSKALAEGFEGLILRSADSHYKFGRATMKSGIAYKVKEFLTFDSVVMGVVQSTEAREGSEKKINELGRSVTSQKKDDRVLIDKACAFIVNYEGKILKVTLAMTDEEKTEVWTNQRDYIGRTIEYKGMLIGSKDLPRHPVFIRFRDDK